MQDDKRFLGSPEQTMASGGRLERKESWPVCGGESIAEHAEMCKPY